jgi:hypothetical protein
LGLGNPHSRSKAREAPNHRTKNKENMGNLRTTSPIRKKIRTMGRRIKIPGSVATSISVTTPTNYLIIMVDKY